MNKKHILILLVTLVLGFFLWTGYLWKIFSCNIAGSSPCVEYWTINTSESNLLKIIEEVKKEHPELNPPNEPNSTPQKRDYWFDIIFHYSDTNEDVQTWIRKDSELNSTTIAFVAIYTHTDSLTPVESLIMDRKEINRDFDYFENKKQIAKFEKNILSLINKKIDKE